MGLINYTTDKINDLLDKVNEAPEVLENGKTPVFITGITTTLDPGMSATAEVVMVGTDSEGNPQYKINFGVPKGFDGASGGGGGVAGSVQWANVLNKPSWIGSTKPTYTASEVGALPDSTTIPSKTSQLTNDKGFLTSSGFKTINGESIVGSGNIVIESPGGGMPSGDGGNVKVTNASSLDKDNYYAFKPSADGSVEGTFSVIPEANEDRSGLMSFNDKEKLDNLLIRVPLPSGFKDLTAESTDQQVFTAVAELLNSLNVNIGSNYPDDKLNVGFYGCLAFASIMNTQGDYGAQFTLDNNPVSAAFDVQVPESSGSGLQYPTRGTAAFTYITSGKLRTVSLVITLNSSGDSSTYDFSANVEESGDDTYYLPIAVSTLNAGATAEKIKDAFGGKEIFMEAVNAASNRKKLYIYGSLLWLIPVSASVPFGITGYFAFLHIETDRIIIKHISSSTVRCFYPSGYSLPDSFFSLTSSSTSDEISTAVGGESGLKAIIQALKDGNRLKGKYVIPDSNPSQSVELTVTSSTYVEGDSGDLSLVLGFEAFLVLSFTRIGIAINYIKSSNTFACGVTTD